MNHEPEDRLDQNVYIKSEPVEDVMDFESSEPTEESSSFVIKTEEIDIDDQEGNNLLDGVAVAGSSWMNG